MDMDWVAGEGGERVATLRNIRAVVRQVGPQNFGFWIYSFGDLVERLGGSSDVEEAMLEAETMAEGHLVPARGWKA
ncbi:hypothetical protein CR162_21170 [Pseudoroseomonas rhizosphaerae]|uniref:Uncharacterized protein n=1 Tax=Teichococcus rhizosphaerae TaxID=1335062 RepID=A0A2C7A6K3_9PROT|nr:hypothetical protein [Pseudoroseomonas rhizosphaerae]PHK92945.1 hypothetical protein CR162_21170 [Pseudoroseomonas rhizosphaerae]